MAAAVRVGDDANRAKLVAEVVRLRAKQRRLPAHFEAEQIKAAKQIDRLVDRIVAMDRAAV